MLHVQELVNLKIYLYAQTMGQQRMLYIRGEIRMKLGGQNKHKSKKGD